MRLVEALGVVLPHLRDELVIHANGFITRESYALVDRRLNFYMLGSMGLASSIGLGLALAQPRRRVLVFDGDGNLLMNLGSLAMTAALQPVNFLHLCFDNGVYASTGNQRTISTQVRLEALAAAAGYVAAARVTTPEDLERTFCDWLPLSGPRFLLVRIEPDGEERPLPRVAHAPDVMAAQFRAACAREP